MFIKEVSFSCSYNLLFWSFSSLFLSFRSAFRNTLENDIISDTSGHFKRLLVALCNGSRDESGITDVEKARADANALLQAGKLKVGTDESVFNMILCQRNFQQLKLVCSVDVIKCEFKLKLTILF
jgi:hypothetical protein